jgi:hypothetical protein
LRHRSGRPGELHLELDIVTVDLDLDLALHVVWNVEFHGAGPQPDLDVTAFGERGGECGQPFRCLFAGE